MIILNVSVAQAAAPATILVLGDSLSAGHGIKAEQAWPRLLEAELKQRGKPFQVINASISGDTSAGGRSRFSALIKKYPAQWVIIELGANDGLRGLPTSEMQQNLAHIIQTAQDRGSRVHLIGMQIPPNYGAAYTSAFSRSYQTLAKDYRVSLTPFLLAPIAADRTMFQADQLHPTAQAQPLIMRGVLHDLLKNM